MTNRAAGRIVPPQSRGYSDRSNRGVLRCELGRDVAIAGPNRSGGDNDA
jgi:hypothetical protein